MDRVSIFRDPEIIQWLKNYFIPFAGEQLAFRRQNPIFATRLDSIVYNPNKVKEPNIQSHYIVSGQGKVYGAFNARWAAKDVADTKERIRRWQNQAIEEPGASGLTIPAEGNKPFDIHEPPSDVSVMTAFSRAATVPRGLNHYAGHYSRSQLWITGEEVKAILTASEGKSAPFWMPKSIVLNMVAGNLIDNVRAGTNQWVNGEVKAAAFSVQAVSSGDTVRKFVFSGPFEMRRAAWDCGYVGSISGEFDVNIRQSKITRFKALASGEAWGDMTWHGGPGIASGPHFTLDIAFVLTTDPVDRVMMPSNSTTLSRDGSTPTLVIP